MKKNIINLKYVWILVLPLFIHSCNKEQKSIQLTSPDANYAFKLDVEEGLSYSVSWKNEILIDKSSLGFELVDGSSLPGEVKIEEITRSSTNEKWHPVYGEKNTYTDNYNEVRIHMKSSATHAENFGIRIRAYNQGVAFCYEFNQDKNLQVTSELTEFTFPGDPLIWASSRAQSPIEKTKLSALSFVAERPLLAEFSDSIFVALGEARLVDFARMKFEKDNMAPNRLIASLETGRSGSDKNKVKYPVIIPANGYITPWRYIMAGKSPSDILQNNSLILNLNEENKIENPSFIKPGKVIREVTLTTQGGIACVDFARKHNLQFVEFDAGWYGSEHEDESDATTISVDPNRSPGPLDLHHVIGYAKENGIGIILYVNRSALERQLDELLPLYKSWGVKGLKYGFVNVGPQNWTIWLHDAVRKAAANNLMVDIHDEYRPTGYSRTFPNLMTKEGIRGDEESPPNDMVINTIFTRMIAGAGDHTNCYFAERVNKMGSHASQMAKTICVYSPWQFLYWYDRPEGSPGKKGGAGSSKGNIKKIPDLTFYDQVPTVWDDTQVLDGYPGELAVIARKKDGKWYLGVITGTKKHNLSLKLNFLEEGRKYNATIFSDDKSLNTLTNVRIRDTLVTSESVLNQQIPEQNGLAVIFTPVNN